MITWLNDVLSALMTARSNVNNELQTIGAAIYAAGSNLISGNPVAAGGYLQTAGNDLSDLRLNLVMLDASFLMQARTGLILIRNNWPENGAEVDMAAIINAMLIATPDEITYFIGLADAFRQSIWNKPFNKEFYAALARGFEQWE